MVFPSGDEARVVANSVDGQFGMRSYVVGVLGLRDVGSAPLLEKLNRSHSIPERHGERFLIDEDHVSVTTFGFRVVDHLGVVHMAHSTINSIML